MLGNDLLVGSDDIAKRLGFKRLQNTYYYIVHDPSFPAPLHTIRGAKVWSWPEVEEWAATKTTFRKRNPPIRGPRAADFAEAVERLAAERGLQPAEAADLVGAYEIGVCLGFEFDTMRVHTLMRDEESGFPAAVQRIGPAGGTWIWWWPDVEKWAEEHYPDRIETWRTLVLEDQARTEEQNGAASPKKKRTTTKKETR